MRDSPDSLDTRILGAVEFVDAITLQPVPRPLKVTSNQMRFRRNRSGRYVVLGAAGVPGEYTTSFPDAPAAPSPGSLTRVATVEDPAGEYFARQFALALPRDPDPTHAADSTSIFQPLAVAVFPTPARATLPNWCVVRVTARASGAQKPPLSGAIARVRRAADPKIEAFAITNAAGEAMLAIANVPFYLTNPSGTDVIAKDVDAELQVFVHKLGKAVLPEDLAADESAFAASAPKPLKVAAGTTLVPPPVEVDLA